jgi:hypothetical protein
VRRAPDFNFLTDFGVPIIPWKPFWITHGETLVKGFFWVYESLASRVMKRGQYSVTEVICSSYEDLSKAVEKQRFF